MTSLTKQASTCPHCGRDNPGPGLCRPTGNGRPFCHRLVTRFAHPTPCKCADRSAHTALIVAKRAS